MARVLARDALARRGARVRIFGPGRSSHSADWDAPLQSCAALRTLAPVHPVWGPDYTKALCGARLALCFLSKRNRDGYTRRCFEIPATGTPMLSEYSPELAAMFREGVEADFFRSGDELVRKVEFYLSHDVARRELGAAGLERARADGHDVDTRMLTMLRDLRIANPIRQAG